MNPIVRLKKSGYVLYSLVESDMKKLRRLKIKKGKGTAEEALNHKMCIMQATAMVTSQADKDLNNGFTYSDTPACVSTVIQRYMVRLNDVYWVSDRQRNSLKKLIPDILNTAPVIRSANSLVYQGTNPEYLRAERKRSLILQRADIYSCNGAAHIPFTEAVRKIKQAAELYHAPDEGADAEAVLIGEET